MVEADMLNVDQQRARVTAAEFAAKFKSKKEIYNFLTIEANAYLCNPDCLTIYFLKDLATGKKRFVRNNDLQHLACPHFDGLAIENLLQKAAEFPEVINFLPEERDIKRLPRQWVANVAYTIVGEPFQRWVMERVQERNFRLVQERKMYIDLDPEIASVFKNSTAVSTSKGVGAHLLKPGSKRRRTRQQIADQRNFEEVANEQIQDQQAEIQALKEQLQASEQEAENNRAASQILNEMIGRGDAEVAADGSVNVTKQKAFIPNQIGNLEDQ